MNNGPALACLVLVYTEAENILIFQAKPGRGGNKESELDWPGLTKNVFPLVIKSNDLNNGGAPD